MSGLWTVPAVMLAPPAARGITILIGDAGRKKLTAEATALVAHARAVLLADLLYFGESKIVPLSQEEHAKQDYYFGLLLSALGGRLLGTDAGQLCAIARRLRTSKNETDIAVEALGEQSSLVALVSAGLEGTIQAITLDKPPG